MINYAPFLRVPHPLQRPIWLNGMHMTYFLSNNQTAHQILCKSVFNCLRYPPPRRGENVKLLGRGNTLFCHLLSLQYHPSSKTFKYIVFFLAVFELPCKLINIINWHFDKCKTRQCHETRYAVFVLPLSDCHLPAAGQHCNISSHKCCLLNVGL